MKNFLLLTASIAAINAAVPAFGADLAPQPVLTKAPQQPIAPPLYDWTGYYLGVNGGWGSSHNCWDLAGRTPEGCHGRAGGTVGGQIGYRWQIFNMVYGVEGQGNWADFSGSNVSAVLPSNINRTRTDAFGLLTGQIGYAFNTVLLYAKGGAAVTSNTYQINSTATGVEVKSDNVRWGGVVGAGLEVNFAPSWSAGIEYDHLFMPESNVTFPANGSDRIHQDVDMVTLRLNYKLFPGTAK
ncbi:outer membrane beta-barrel protein [Bradyrhizobium sp. CCGB12]|uniref:outer membrane protein n=1 Tax=Bradyrhizobium sp. CCGB12 TaxID=2949632 RepID=UPI0020B308F7|nr:outer membrane beta-barrel protein [Bradyrhizobium sp. CCGB12]MCP3392145.1 outer membrane beta-barrel protein [Bradyrhizobium sp. CCGB12]